MFNIDQSTNGVNLSFDPGALLRTAQHHTTSLAVPIPLSRYWMMLQRAAEDAAQRTDKLELILALLATTDPDGAALSDRLTRFRTLKIRDLPGLCGNDHQPLILPRPHVGRKAGNSAY